MAREVFGVERTGFRFSLFSRFSLLLRPWRLFRSAFRIPFFASRLSHSASRIPPHKLPFSLSTSRIPPLAPTSRIRPLAFRLLHPTSCILTPLACCILPPASCILHLALRLLHSPYASCIPLAFRGVSCIPPLASHFCLAFRIAQSASRVTPIAFRLSHPRSRGTYVPGMSGALFFPFFFFCEWGPWFKSVTTFLNFFT